MTNLNYEIKKVTKENEKELSALIDECFGLKTHTPIQLICWKFFTPPQDLTSYGAFTKDNLLASFYSNKKFEIANGTKEYKSSICIDMATSLPHRRKGLISKLSKRVYSELEKDGYDFAIGFSNAKGVMVDKHSRDYGYQVVGRFKTYRKILTPTLRKSRVQVKKVKNAKGISDMASNGYFHLKMSKKYTNWRYVNGDKSELYSYYTFSREGKSLGYIVTQETGKKVGILKIGASTKTDFKKIMSAAEKHFASKGKVLMTITILPNNFWKGILNGGWKFLSKKENYYFTVRKINCNDDDIFDSEKWILVGGDII